MKNVGQCGLDASGCKWESFSWLFEYGNGRSISVKEENCLNSYVTKYYWKESALCYY